MKINHILILFICLIKLINSENPLTNATNSKISLISSKQKQDKPTCLLFAAKSKNDENSTSPVYFASIPIGSDVYSASIYDTHQYGENDYTPELIVVLDEYKVLNLFGYRVDSNTANDVYDIYQLNIGGTNYKINFQATNNKYKKYYYDDFNIIMYIDNKSNYLGFKFYDLSSSKESGFPSSYIVPSSDVQDKLQCDLSGNACYVFNGKEVYEIDMLSSIVSQHSSLGFTFDLAESSINGYKDKLLLSGNSNNMGYVNIYYKSSKSNKPLLSLSEKIFPLALSYNSRYAGVITQTTYQFYLIDLEDDSHEIVSNNLKITELYKGIDSNNLFKFSLSSIVPKTITEESSSSDISSSSVNNSSSSHSEDNSSKSSSDVNSSSDSSTHSHSFSSSDIGNEVNSTSSLDNSDIETDGSSYLYISLIILISIQIIVLIIQ